MEYLIKSSVLILLIYIGYALFLKKETFFNHNRWFLLIGLITALILPLIVIPIYITIEPIVISETATNFTDNYAEIIPQDRSFDWSQLLTNLYLIGLTVFFIQFILQFGSLALLLLKNSKDRDGIYTYVIVKNKISPFSFFKWIVYNPNLFSDDELKLILNHEKVHVRQWHSMDIIVSRLACVVFWFNPFVWLYHKNIQQNLEYIADENAQDTSNSETDYQRLLLKTTVGNNNINLTSNFYNSLIKKRIIMLQKQPSKSINRWKSIIILPFFFIFLMSFNTKEIYVETPQAEKESFSTDNSSIEVYFSTETTDESLKDIKKKLKAEGVLMTIKEKTRNADGLLTSLNLTFESEGSSANYWANNKNGIKPFYFIKKSDGSIAVGPTKVIEIIEEPGVIEIIETEAEPIIEIIEEEEEENEENAPVVKSSRTITINDFTIDEDENNFKIKADTIHIIEGQPKVKASYTYITKDTIVIGKPIHTSKVIANGNVKIRSNSFTIDTDSINFKNSIKLRNTNGKNPIYILNGKRISKKKFKKLNPNNIATVDVIKDKSAIKLYGETAKDGVVVIKTQEKGPWKISTKVNSVNSFKEASKGDVKKLIASGKNPVIVIDNEVIGSAKIKDIDYDVAKSVAILKGEGATNLFGKKAKDGAIVIYTKDHKVKHDKSNHKVHVQSIVYADDDASENALFYYISKNTTDDELKLYKNKLAKHNITVKFNKVKRNNSGEITGIKISISDNKGSKSSATWKNETAIPDILVGKKGNKLIASSSF